MVGQLRLEDGFPDQRRGTTVYGDQIDGNRGLVVVVVIGPIVSNPGYAAMVRRGYDLLSTIGYP